MLVNFNGPGSRLCIPNMDTDLGQPNQCEPPKIWSDPYPIRIRSGSEINILDPDSNPDPKPDPKQICLKESYFQAKKRYFQTIMEFFNIFNE
jgi:hypothetical protein